LLGNSLKIVAPRCVAKYAKNVFAAKAISEVDPSGELKAITQIP